MSKSNEAFWWTLFSAGGVMTALFIPAIIVATGFLLPTADSAVAAERFEHVYSAAAGWPVRVVLFVVLGLSFFHCAHRIRHTLMDLGLRHIVGLLMLVSYGGASVGTLAAAILLWKL